MIIFITSADEFKWSLTFRFDSLYLNPVTQSPPTPEIQSTGSSDSAPVAADDSSDIKYLLRESTRCWVVADMWDRVIYS